MAVYVVKYSDYDYWENCGYFTNKREAEKFCISKRGAEYYVEILSCLDGEEDLSNIKVMYTYQFDFVKKDNLWECSKEDDPSFYSEEYLRSNSIKYGRNGIYVSVNILANSESDDIKLAEKIAQDIFHQYLDSCNGNPSQETVDKFNKILSVAENERKEKERLDKIREEELKELERLKLKYENND